MTDHLADRGDWRSWHALGSSLDVGPGVHAPSAFSALLAASLASVRGRTVIDAGCGAGLITIAALNGGAERVIALDRDPHALRITQRNVAATLGAPALRRLTAEHADLSQLSELDADLIAVNPPQRPTRLLRHGEPEQRHLHEGGGEDGLTTLRAVLRATPNTLVYSTAARVLDLPHALPEPDHEARDASIVISAGLPAHPSWQTLAGPGPLTVDVWAFSDRRSGRSSP